jgi:hypothetical protein
VKKDLKVFFINKVKRQPMELEKIFSNYIYIIYSLDFPGDSDSKEYACNAGYLGSIPRSGRSLGEGHDNPLKYSCPENSLSMTEEPGKVQSMGSQGVTLD